MKKRKMTGCVHVYTGSAKGKTSSATGLAVRMAGSGGRVLFVKYLKPKSLVSSEEKVFGLIKDNLVLVKINARGIIGTYTKSAEERIIRECRASLAVIEKQWQEFDMVVLDEINVVLGNGYIGWDAFRDLLDRKPEHIELVCTGRNAPRGLIQRADYVTHLKLGKHPFSSGLKARRGVEF